MGQDTAAGPDWARWLDSMEGVPEWVPVRKPPTGVHPRVAKVFEGAGRHERRRPAIFGRAFPAGRPGDDLLGSPAIDDQERLLEVFESSLEVIQERRGELHGAAPSRLYRGRG